VASTISHSPAETFELGRLAATELRGGEVFALVGELGSGKTHFVKGLAVGLGYRDEVTSPTFTLVHEYLGGRFPLFHFDFYRLASAEETLRVGFDDYLDGNGILAIEWADKFTSLLPAETRWIRFRIATGDTREIDL
jgi:tRNA threonylcarbamoyladenosine biosynthesis protein TsaE